MSETEQGDAPARAEIRHADGRVTPCLLVRDPQDSPDGMAQWVAIAPPGTPFGSGDIFWVDVLPARSTIRVEGLVPA